MRYPLAAMAPRVPGQTKAQSGKDVGRIYVATVDNLASPRPPATAKPALYADEFTAFMAINAQAGQIHTMALPQHSPLDRHQPATFKLTNRRLRGEVVNEICTRGPAAWLKPTRSEVPPAWRS